MLLVVRARLGCLLTPLRSAYPSTKVNDSKLSDEVEGTEKCRANLDPEMIVPFVPLTLTTQPFGITI